MRIIAFINEAGTVKKILDHSGEATQPPGFAPARGPPLWEAAAKGFPYLNRKRSFSSPTSIVSLDDRGRGSWPMDFPFRRAGVFPSTWVMK